MGSEPFVFESTLIPEVNSFIPKTVPSKSGMWGRIFEITLFIIANNTIYPHIFKTEAIPSAIAAEMPFFSVIFSFITILCLNVVKVVNSNKAHICIMYSSIPVLVLLSIEVPTVPIINMGLDE